jgi:hypothetical protein
LVALHEPGYFRMYGPVICELERRGWTVGIAFDTPEKRGGAQVPAGAGPHVASLGALPQSDDGVLAHARLAMDYVRYLEPPFARAGYLRQRAARRLAPGFRWLTRLPILPAWMVGGAVSAARTAEGMLAADPRVVHFMRAYRPDLVLVSPLVTMNVRGSGQTEVVKAARALGIPVVVGVASWDHLTSKGLIRVLPDVLTVWNDVQRDEAIRLHRVPPSRIVVTGAQPLDHWFERPSDPDGQAFRRALGLEPGRALLLFVGSSLNMAPGDSEVRFVRRWLASVRASSDRRVAGAFVLVRPHPSNTKQWAGVDLDDRGTAIQPSSYSGMPLRDDEVEAFRSALLASQAVVGINTTAMIEAAILRRPVLSVRDAAFVHSQLETIHFGYLAADSGGCALVADTLEQHAAQLSSVLGDAGGQVAAADRFVSRFVRPHGRDRRATSVLADAIERCARGSSSVRAEAAAERSA